MDMDMEIESEVEELSCGSYDEENLDEHELFEMDIIGATIAIEYYNKYLCKQPYRNDSLTGAEYVMRVIVGNPNRCLDLFRMESHVFLNFCTELRKRNLLHDSRFVSVEEKVGIFLMTIGHNNSNRLVADRFQHSGETISRHFGKVLKAIVRYGKEIIVPPSFERTPPEIQTNPKYYPYFQDCVGAIDGTHVSAFVPSRHQIPYRGRKTIVTQNVLCACSFDMRFTFVLAGWEGTANDSRVFVTAVTNPEYKFPNPPEGKYYVVDSGFTNMHGYLSPYRGEHYHLQEYRGRGRQPTRAKELFNYRHSSLRNVIERCFGVLKKRFPILKMMPSYSLKKQTRIVIAACAIHNFIRREAQQDSLFAEFENEELVIEEEQMCGNTQNVTEIDRGSTSRREMATIRDRITRRLARAHGIDVL